MRVGWLIVLLVACDSRKKAPPPPPPVVADAAIDAPVIDIAKTPLAGKLAGKPFHVAKAMLRTNQGDNELALYGWSTGEPCEPQFAPEPDQLYISIHFPKIGVIRSTDRNVIVTYKRPTLDPVKSEATVVFDEPGKGRLVLDGPDTHVEGSFEATVCGSPQQPRDPQALHGIAWGERLALAKLPAQPVETVLLGANGKPVAVEVIDWKDEYEQHEVHFFLTPPKQPCAYDQMSPGFKIGFSTTIAAGQTIEASSSTVTHRGEPWGVVLWEEPGNVIGMEGSGYVTAKIDAVTDAEIRGRVYAYFNDASKSMIAGAFVAKNCHAKP